MKRNLTIFTCVAITLLGGVSCANQTNIPSENPPAATNPNQSQITVASSSSTQDFMRILASSYETANPNTKITQLQPGQSENIISGVSQGIIDIGAISKVLNPQEQDSILESREVAKDAIVVATHPTVTGVENLTTENLKGIYSGQITNWQEIGGPDAEIVLLDRPEDESAKRLLRQHYLGQELEESPTAVILRKEGELIQAVQNTPYSIGAFSLAYAISHNLPVNRLRLNNVEPTVENITSGDYLMLRSISVVWNTNASAPTQSFVNHIFSEPGNQILTTSGFAPLP